MVRSTIYRINKLLQPITMVASCSQTKPESAVEKMGEDNNQRARPVKELFARAAIPLRKLDKQQIQGSLRLDLSPTCSFSRDPNATRREPSPQEKNLGFLWVFFKYPKISKNGNPLFFPVLQAIHRMQIWRTTRSAPGTSCMKVRLVRPQCFVLTICFPWKVLLRERSSLFYFAMPTSFCVLECQQKGQKLSSVRV